MGYRSQAFEEYFSRNNRELLLNRSDWPDQSSDFSSIYRLVQGWLLYADHQLAPLWRSRNGYIGAIINNSGSLVI